MKAGTLHGEQMWECSECGEALSVGACMGEAMFTFRPSCGAMMCEEETE